MKKPRKYWFKNKTYGYGWTPVTWQGWLVTIIFIGLVIGVTVTYRPVGQPSLWEVTSAVLLPVLGLVLILLGITVWTGEKPEWRWGAKRTSRESRES